MLCRDDILEDNQSGNLGEDLGRGGMTFGLTVEDTPGGSFTLGNPDEIPGSPEEVELCCKVRVKSCPLKAKVRVSLSKSKACA